MSRKLVPHRVVGVLVAVEGDLEGEIYRVVDGENRIGRSPDCEIELGSKKISREHAKLIHRDGVFAIERQSSKAATDLKDNQDRLQVARDASAEAKKRIDEFDQTLRTNALTLVGELTQQLSDVDEKLKGLRDVTNRLQVIAPVDGIVKGLTVNAINAVVRPGETMLELVPTGEDVVVEARLSPLDIGHVQVGQNVDVRVTAFDFSTYGALKGIVEKISASTFQAEDGTPYYKATVALDHHYLGDDPNRNKVLPGMVVQANVITGSKSLLDYLMKPINRGFARSFQER